MTASGMAWLLVLIHLIILFAATAWALRQRLYLELSWTQIMLSALPAGVMVLSFFALALHMNISLDGWPRTLGYGDFHMALARHARLTLAYFNLIAQITLLGWPVAVLICAAVARWRRFIVYLTLYEMAMIGGLLVMMMGPSRFLSWWWD